MDDWSANEPSFAALFSRLRLPPPPDHITHTSTLNPTNIDMLTSGPYFHGFSKLSIENLQLSNDHTLQWATYRLCEYGPTPLDLNATVWDLRFHRRNIPQKIRSENDTMSYIKVSLVEPTLTTAIFIRAQHLGLTAAHGARYPLGNWELFDCSSTGRSGRGDYGVIRSSNVPADDQSFAAVFEIKTSHVCHSNGVNLDGQRQSPIYVLQYLPEWLEREGGYIPMDKSGSLSTRTDGAFDWHTQPWQKKIQKILFQCWHAMFSRKTEHCVLANEDEFILVLRKGNRLLLSKRYSCCPSNEEDTYEMMTHLSYFLAHGLCRRYPSHDDDVEAPAWPPTNTAALDAASFQSVSLANQGSSRTHAKTDSQATIKAPAHSTMMRFAKSLVRLLNARCTASSVTFNLMGCSSPTAIRLWTPKQHSTIVLSHVIQWGIECHVFRGHFGRRPIVAKICADRTHRAESGLREEYAVYQTLRGLQGSAIPRCYGLFRVADFADLLLLEDCGESLKSYDELTAYQRASFWSHVSDIHRHNVCHQDLEPRNIVMSTSGQLRVVDFELSDRFHNCVPQGCHELQGLASEIQGTSLNNILHPGSHMANPINRHVWLLSLVGVMVLVYLLEGGGCAEHIGCSRKRFAQIY